MSIFGGVEIHDSAVRYLNKSHIHEEREILFNREYNELIKQERQGREYDAQEAVSQWRKAKEMLK